jgi:hypothetical protein
LFVTFSRSREIGCQDYNSSENYVVRSFQMAVAFLCHSKSIIKIDHLPQAR